ncbi:tyrosine-type recombinase/integrase [Dyella sp. BiH032]|uniref:tyrosine-type recombinase/integrase n=1 Tax=Dyella sp. BiH032 TaxID=3075430 RepID=UPI0028937095|nr:integrase arm-type DNA-binding domain-containing protein [Dyella sp. BiH032]WNL46517.1 tyrosine-type recombinase/integrase [Dyella sp. BiH032]
MAELTAVAARNAKPREKMYRLAAGKGLYLQVMPNGSKYWRLKYRLAQKPKMIGLGVFPEMTLAAARDARDDARRLLASGVDPSTARRVDKVKREVEVENTFEACARAWFARKSTGWVETYSCKVIRRLEMYVFPRIGYMPIADIESWQLVDVLDRAGSADTAHRILTYLMDIYRWAKRAGKAKFNMAADLQGSLPSIVRSQYPHITDPERIGEFLRAVDGYRGLTVTKLALKFAPLVFTRPGEMRMATWSEFDLDKGLWVIPAERMKMRKALKAVAEPHVVPLSRQAVDILKELHRYTGSCQYAFPGARSTKRPMSNNTLNAALHNLGYKDEIVVHGLRHMASTALNEAGWKEDAVERQLAHKDKNKIRGTYNKAKYLEERSQMMQAWADYLDGLRSRKPAIAKAA